MSMMMSISMQKNLKVAEGKEQVPDARIFDVKRTFSCGGEKNNVLHCMGITSY